MRSFYAAFLFCFLLTSCGVIGEKRNIILQSNGITATKDYLQVDNITSLEKEFVSGSEVHYLLEGVSGFSIKDDKALFGCSMVVMDQSTNKEILHYDDLFADSGDGYSKDDASQLNFTLSIGTPMIVGGKYRWKLRLWDKRGKGDLTAEMPFTVVEGKDLVGIKTTSKGLAPAKVYIVSNGSLKSTDVKVGQKLTMYFEGLTGYAVQPDTTVGMGASMMVVDKDGANVLEYSDLFKDNLATPLSKATSVTLYLKVGDPMKAGQTYRWKMRVWDKNNKNSVESSITLKVLADD
jgi:hypothetical protein